MAAGHEIRLFTRPNAAQTGHDRRIHGEYGGGGVFEGEQPGGVRLVEKPNQGRRRKTVFDRF